MNAPMVRRDSISENDRHKIGRDNAIKLFKLPLP